MPECEKCEKNTMGFTCKYCGETFCSEHRLPENHDCSGLDEDGEPLIKQEESKTSDEQVKKWFTEDKVKKRPPATANRSLTRDILDTLRQNMTLSIITVTVIAFFLQMNFPGTFEGLYLDPNLDQILDRPWTIITVMLVHGSLFHIFANMVTFYFFGYALEKVIGGKKLVAFYIASGIIASLAFVAVANLQHILVGPTIGDLPTLRPAVGASGAVIAAFGATAMLYPNAKVLLYFFIPLKIKTAVYGVGIIELVNLLAKFNGISLPVIGAFASSAHLAGLVVGMIAGIYFRKKHNPRTDVIDILSN